MRLKANKALGRSLWVYLCNTGSCNGCDIECVALGTSRYDVERLGVKIVGSPRHADVLIVTGPVTRKMEPRLRMIYEQMPDPRFVIVAGVCGMSGGMFYDSYALAGPIDQIIPVDVYVPGCPTRPEAVIHGLSLLLEKLEKMES
ncbi:MAG: NADH-quinone oxidoreductase subunit B family protein [Verrucomicrobiota bacterium]|jgi:membrane-bound hydrogenase subunit mbhJ|nr:NADH-quinone oxidoreductase subunit B family protein [Verrucomicrobiota bacterium]